MALRGEAAQIHSPLSICGNQQQQNDMGEERFSGCAPGCRQTEIPADLQRVIDAWPRLTPAEQAQILKIVDRSMGRRK